MSLRFAYALSNNNFFKERHFGEADKYAIYDLDSNAMELITEIPNPFRNLTDFRGHGSENKGKAITNLLKEHGVTVLVSRQFGENIKIVNRNFIPVIINEESPEQVSNILKKHKNWVQEELDNSPSEFSTFFIKQGILKSKIRG